MSNWHLDWFESLVTLAITIFLIVCIACMSSCIHTEYKFYKIPYEKCHALLLNVDYKPSTKEYHSAPIFNLKGGMSYAWYSTGHSEKHITIWDCGKYGTITSDDEHIFRFAKKESVLHIKEYNNEVRIVGIERGE